MVVVVALEVDAFVVAAAAFVAAGKHIAEKEVIGRN